MSPLVLLALLEPSLASVVSAGIEVEDLTELSLEQLMDLEVTSVSRTSESLSRAPAAVTVLTSEDLRRSGATSVMEALRLVPGLQVARISASRWAITARGFNGPFANKMLVMVDGRTVYTSLFSGVFWDGQDLPLDDVERIEVIRGPGATMWGANAVNGVIHVFTRDARDTTGSAATFWAGDEERYGVSGRVGDELGEDGAWRAWVRGFERDPSANRDGSDFGQEWTQASGGFRADWDDDGDAWTVIGNAYGSSLPEVNQLPLTVAPFTQAIDRTGDVRGANALARWRTEGPVGSLVFQTWLDHADRESSLGRDRRTTFDLEVQHEVPWRASHDLVWGLGYRVVGSDFDGTSAIDFGDPTRTDHWLSAFVQDEFALPDERWRVTLGSKLSQNDFTGFELQPSARLAFAASETWTLWSAVSRAVRLPSQVEDDVQLLQGVIPGPMGSTTQIVLGGDPALDAEELWAYEVGARWQATRSLGFDVAAFLHRFDDLITVQAADPQLGFPVSTIPVSFTNAGRADVGGLEVAAEWQPREGLAVRATYALLEVEPTQDAGGNDTAFDALDRRSPRHSASLFTRWDPADSWELDTALYWVDELADFGVPSYLRADARVGWRASEDWELSLVVQNALDPSHPEFGTTPASPSSEIERSVFVTARWTP